MTVKPNYTFKVSGTFTVEPPREMSNKRCPMSEATLLQLINHHLNDMLGSKVVMYIELPDGIDYAHPTCEEEISMVGVSSQLKAEYVNEQTEPEATSCV